MLRRHWAVDQQLHFTMQYPPLILAETPEPDTRHDAQNHRCTILVSSFPAPSTIR